MSTVEIREDLHRLIDQADDQFVAAMHLIFGRAKTEKPYGFESDGTPIYASQLGSILDKEVEAAENGDYVSAQELDEISKEWVKRIK